MRHLQKISSVLGPILSFFASTAYAQQPIINTGINPIQNATQASSALCNIFGLMFWVLISVSIIMFLYAAYLYVFSGGDEEKPTEARMTILYAVFGIIAALLAKGAPVLIAGLFGKASSVNGC
jgi:heme/copper-type cytochrome/quinol oxidase subunit 2